MIKAKKTHCNISFTDCLHQERKAYLIIGRRNVDGGGL